MIDAVVFCPQAPALVPAVGRGVDAELAVLRTTCATALAEAAATADRVVLLGGGDRSRRFPPGARGSFAGFGVPVDVAIGVSSPGAGDDLPPSLCVGAWLIGEAMGSSMPVEAWSVGPAGLVDAVVPPDGSTLLLVVGDGSARRSEKAPGYLDPRASAHDAATADALRRGDPSGLRRRPDDDALLVAGSMVWDATAKLTEATGWRADLRYDDAPFGVGYLVAVWMRLP